MIIKLIKIYIIFNIGLVVFFLTPLNAQPKCETNRVEKILNKSLQAAQNKNYQSAHDSLLVGLKFSTKCFGLESRETLNFYHHISYVYEFQKDYLSAIKYAEKMLPSIATVYDTELAKIGITERIAGLYQKQRDFFLSSEIRENIVEQLTERIGRNADRTHNNISRLAESYMQLGKLEKAEILLIEIFDFYSDRTKEPQEWTIRAANNLGAFYKNQGNYPKSEDLLRYAYHLSQKLLQQNDELALSVKENLGELLALIGKPVEAEKLLLAAIKARVETFGKSQEDFFLTLYRLTVLYSSEKKIKLAQKYENMIIENGKEVYGEDHPFYIYLKTNLDCLNLSCN